MAEGDYNKFAPKVDWGGGQKQRRYPESRQTSVRTGNNGTGRAERTSLRQQLNERQHGVSAILGVPLEGRTKSIHHEVRKGGEGRDDLDRIKLETLSEHSFEHLKEMMEAPSEEKALDEESAMLSLQERMSREEREEFADLTERMTGSRVYFVGWGGSPEQKRKNKAEREKANKRRAQRRN